MRGSSKTKKRVLPCKCIGVQADRPFLVGPHPCRLSTPRGTTLATRHGAANKVRSRGAGSPRREDRVIIEVQVEDDLKQIVEEPAAKRAIEQAVHRVILDLKQAHWDKLSRQSVMSRGFIGTQK
jgi:hypothetical protein